MSLRRLSLVAITALTAAACSTPAPSGGSTSTGSTSTDASTGASTDTAMTSGPATTSEPPPPTCVQKTAAALTPQQKAAQLILVAMTPSTIGTVSAQIGNGDAGGVFLLGGWNGISVTSAATKQIHGLTDSTAGIGLWVAIDQEGGEVQQLRGPGITPIPSALEQGAMDPATLTADATTWAAQLADGGADINLAPVADVVPADVGKQNAPIGLYNRQYGATPEQVTPAVIAFMKGMQAGGVLPTVKHFPGIGRILGNTDTTTVGISDQTMTVDDPLLAPFQAAIDAGAPIVMVSTARYPKIDPDNQAAFSSAVIDGLLRAKLGFDGVVMSDDLGAAKSVAAIPVAERITRFIAAGGDVVLTAQPAQAAEMNAAVVARYTADAQFAAKVDDAAARVLALKDSRGELPCSG